MYPSPLGQIAPKYPFLLPSSMMAEADGTHTAPLDLFDREWPLPSYVANPPSKVIPPTADHKPPDCMTKPRCRKRSSLRSHWKSSLLINKSTPTTINSSPQPFLYSLSPPFPSNAKLHTVETSKLPQRLSSSIVHIQNVEPCNLKLPPSPSQSTRNIEPTCLELSPYPSSANFKNVETSKLPPPPSTSTAHLQHVEPCNFKLLPSPSQHTHNVEPTGL